MENLSGKLIKSYELKELIGEGGFGAVYRAYQSLIRREVAVKIILPQHANRSDFIRRFETEAQLVARLEHPYIVPLYDYWREPSGAYLVMRWLRGGSLQNALQKDGAWEPMRVSRMLNQIGEALAVAHLQGIIHRDLKLENILLDENGNAYLTDFGIAKDLGGKERITQGNAILGSPAYLAPEQIKGEEVTPQSDIYSLGILLFELLTGKLPFASDNAATLLYKHLSEPLPDLVTINPDLPLALNAVIQRATAKDASSRYVDTIALATDFRRAVKDEGGDETSITGTALITSTGLLMPEPENPYKGLRAFQQADASDFFGREQLVQRLLDRLNEAHPFAGFLAVIGPSGSGKSSVVKAGLLPALQRGALIGSDEWFITEMVPGIDPIEELEAALLRVAVNPPTSLLAQLKEDTRGLVRAIKRVLPEETSELVLLIDQFEELFTLVDEESDRANFLDSLLLAIAEPRSRLRVIITLRADFYDRPLQYVRFGELLRQRTEIVLPLTSQELEQAIVAPAARAAITLEPGLVKAIVADVNDQPGTLPLLQYALTELFERRKDRTLTLAAYNEIGGTSGALAQRADELFDGLGDDGQEAARQLFLRLVTLGEGTEDTRRRAHLSELLSIGQNNGSEIETMSMVIDAFGRYRLLTFDHDPATRTSTVEVAHEALIRQWGQLREWLNINREDLRQQRRLANAAEEWLNAGKDPSFLARGARLQQIEDWRSVATISLNTEETEYLAASVEERKRLQEMEAARQEREEALEKASRNRLRALVAVMSVAAVIALVLALLAVSQGRRAQVAREEAEISATEAVQARTAAENSAAETNSLALAANARSALIENNPSLAVALALEASEAYQPAPVEVLRVLANSIYGPGVRARLAGHEAAVLGTAFSADGRLGVSAGLDGTLRVWDVVTRENTLTLQVEGVGFTSAVFVGESAEESRLYAGATDGRIYVWETSTGTPLDFIEGHEQTVTSLATNSAGDRLLSGSLDRTLRLWSLPTGEILQTIEGHTGIIFAVDLSDDGRLALSSSGDAVLTNDANDAIDRTTRLWDTETGEELWQFPSPGGYVRTVQISPDGLLALTATWSSASGGIMSLLDIQTGTVVRQVFGHTDIITGVAFSTDSRRFISVSWDRTLRVWSTATGVALAQYNTFADRLLSASISPNSDYALIGTGNYGNNEIDPELENSADTSVWLIDLRSRDEIRQFAGSQDWLWSMDISADGQRAASGSGPLRPPIVDTKVRIWDLATGTVIHEMQGHTDTVEGVEFSPDGSLVVSAAWDGTVILWDAASGEEILRFGAVGRAHNGRAINAAFSPDGALVASSDSEGLIILWDAATGEEIRRFEGHEGEVGNIAFSPDGRLLASASADLSVRLWDVATGDEVRRLGVDGLAHSGQANDVVFSPNGTQLLSSSWDSSIKLWDIASGDLLRRFDGHNGPTFGMAFSPDGQVFVSTSSDTTVRMWDIATGQEIRRLNGHTNWVSEVEFTPDGQFALSSGQDNVLRMWQVPRTAEEIITWGADNRYMRELTCAERAQFRVEPLCEQ